MEITVLIRRLETASDPDTAYTVSRAIMEFILKRPGDKVTPTNACVDNCYKLLSGKINSTTRCLIFCVLSACCCDQATVRQFIKKGIHVPLMRTLLHLIKTPWSDDKSKETILLKESINLLQKMSAFAAVDTDTSLIDDLLKEGILNRIVDLLDAPNSPLFQYSNAGGKLLRDLILKKPLVGIVSVLKEEDIVSSCQSFMRTNLKLSWFQKGSLLLHLYDTTSVDEVDIEKELVDSGEVWHIGDDGLPSTAENEPHAWIDIFPVHIENTGHFWAHTGGQTTLETVSKIESSLSRFPVKDRQMVVKEPPVGSFVCGICKREGQKPMSFRGVVLEVVGSLAVVFALDYGFRCRVPYKNLCYLTSEMNVGGIPPQATLCVFKAVQPPPVSIQCLKSVLALTSCLLPNEKCLTAFLKLGGMDILYRRCAAPDITVSCMAIGCVSNIARFKFMRPRLSDTKFMQLLLRCCVNLDPRSLDPSHGQLIMTSLGLLKNMMFHCTSNRHKFLEHGGVEILMTLYKKAERKDIRSRALGVFKVLMESACFEEESDGDCIIPEDSKSAENLEDEENVGQPPAEDVSERSRKHRRELGVRRSRSQSKQASLSRERLHRQPHDSSDEEPSLNRSGSCGEDTDGEMIITSACETSNLGEGEIIPVNAAFLDPSCASYYIRGVMVSFSNDEFHDIRPTQLIYRASQNTIARIACALLNNKDGGSIFFGIGQDRHVFGIPVDRHKRDEFRLGIDRLMVRFIPPVFHAMYDVIYSPVIDNLGHDDPATRKHVPDHYVIEIKLEKNTSTVYTTPEGKCYFRYGANTVPVSTQEVRHRAILQEETRFLKEIDALRNELSQLHQTLR